jgi:plasmid stability protein
MATSPAAAKAAMRNASPRRRPYRKSPGPEMAVSVVSARTAFTAISRRLVLSTVVTRGRVRASSGPRRCVLICGLEMLLAIRLQWDHTGPMPTVHVRDVSDDALTTLKVRAARSGQSLQSYLRQLLEGEAEMLTPEEAAERARAIAARSAVTADDVVDAIADMRESRR